jgi:bifunctional ADP-heptose synthase (sugar kinase/adenylyltransferase)
MRCLSKAKQLGDLLFVCLSNDEQIKRLKGESRKCGIFEKFKE